MGAAPQSKIDKYGELVDPRHAARRYRIEPSDDAWRVQKVFMKFLESNWDQPDEGIWEMRGPRRQFTHSKVMAWVAMDRAIQRSEEHTSELQSLMRFSYAVFCLNKNQQLPSFLLR